MKTKTQHTVLFVLVFCSPIYARRSIAVDRLTWSVVLSRQVVDIPCVGILTAEDSDGVTVASSTDTERPFGYVNRTTTVRLQNDVPSPPANALGTSTKGGIVTGSGHPQERVTGKS